MQTACGRQILVDAADEAELCQFKWHLVCGYAARQVPKPGGGKTWLSMHRQLMGLGYGDARQVDHRNRDRLDNRRENLRLATSRENSFNNSKRLGVSGVRGVYPCGSRWQAKISDGKGRVRHLGLFASKEQAGEFRALVAEMLHGDFVSHLSPEAA